MNELQIFDYSQLSTADQLPVHPAADIFPMMSDEELADLAESIKANGLRYPIIIDAEGQLIDGRNRLAACKLAGIKPRFESLNGHDPLAYIADTNLKRRNMTKGQQAIALAMIYPEPERGRGKKDEARKGAESASFSYRRLKEARQVLAFSRPMAEAVLKGVDSLDEALRQVEEKKQLALGKEARLEMLRKGAPDLAVLVDEGRLSLDGAIDEWNRREKQRQAIYRSGVNSLNDLVADLTANVSAIISGASARGESDPPLVVTPEMLGQAQSLIDSLRRFSQGATAMLM